MSAPVKVRSKTVTPPARRRSRSSTSTEPGPVAETKGEGDNTVSLYGDLHGGLTQIRASSIRLVLTFGEFSDGRDVLIPLVDWQTYGHQVAPGVDPKPDDRGELLSSQLLSLDNLAFLLQDLSYDTRDAVRLLVSQSKGDVSPVADRTQYAVRMLKLASKNLLSAAEQMEEMLVKGAGDE